MKYKARLKIPREMLAMETADKLNGRNSTVEWELVEAIAKRMWQDKLFTFAQYQNIAEDTYEVTAVIDVEKPKPPVTVQVLADYETDPDLHRF